MVVKKPGGSRINQLEDSRSKSSFLHRRYATCLGRRYALAAVGVILPGLLGSSKLNGIDSAVAQALPLPSPEFSTTGQSQPQVIDEKLVAANTFFGFKLFREILKQDSSKNIFVSPSSVAIALAMTYNGANGKTQHVAGDEWRVASRITP